MSKNHVEEQNMKILYLATLTFPTKFYKSTLEQVLTCPITPNLEGEFNIDT